MSDIRQLPAVEQRVESGPIQFGDDWPGTFIRGDNAFAYAMYLRLLLGAIDTSSDPSFKRIAITVECVRGLMGLLQESNLNTAVETGESRHAEAARKRTDGTVGL